MRKKLGAGTGLVVLGLGALAVTLATAGPAAAGTPVPPPTGAIVVGTAGQYCPSPSYSTVQSAIDAASAGATIYVCAGTYAESLTIGKAITLLGAQYDVDARTRDGTYETVLNGSGGITYTNGATSGSLNGFTVTGYQGSTAAIVATGTGAGWSFVDDVVDVSNGGIELNTAGAVNPAASDVRGDLFEQAQPSAAPSGTAGQAVIVGGGSGNDLRVTDDAFQNLSGPGAAINTPGTANCGASLDSVNFSENLIVNHDTMTESGGSFTDPLNGPGFVDEPFIDLQCTNDAEVGFDTVTVADSGDAHARTAIELTGGNYSASVEGNALDGGGTPSATGIAVNGTAFPAESNVQVGDNFVSGFATGIGIGAGSGFVVSHNFVKASASDGILVSASSGGSLTGNAVSGSGSEDCADQSTGTATASTADVWLDNGGATSLPAGLCAAFVPPAVTSAADVTAPVGTPLSIAVTTTGYPAPHLTIAHLPSGLTFTDHGNGSGTIAGTPVVRAAGLHKLQVRAVSSFRFSVNTVTQSLTLQLDRPPSFTTSSSKKLVPGSAVRFLVKAAGYPYPALTESGSLPPGLTFTDDHNGTATIAGTPTAPLATASWPLTISAASSAGTASQVLTLLSTQAPATFSGPTRAIAVVGRAFSTTVTAASAYGTPVLSEAGTLPAGITFADDHNGTATIAGTAAASALGTYHVFVTATTAGGSVSERVTLAVDSIPAITSKSSITPSVGLSFHFYVTATGRPRPTVTESGALPPGVVFTPNVGYGTFSGTATRTGTWMVTVTATNAAGTTSQTFTIIVV